MMSVKNVIGVVLSVENVLIQREKNSRKQILFSAGKCDTQNNFTGGTENTLYQQATPLDCQT